MGICPALLLFIQSAGITHRYPACHSEKNSLRFSLPQAVYPTLSSMRLISTVLSARVHSACGVRVVGVRPRIKPLSSPKPAAV